MQNKWHCSIESDKLLLKIWSQRSTVWEVASFSEIEYIRHAGRFDKVWTTDQRRQVRISKLVLQNCFLWSLNKNSFLHSMPMNRWRISLNTIRPSVVLFLSCGECKITKPAAMMSTKIAVFFIFIHSLSLSLFFCLNSNNLAVVDATASSSSSSTNNDDDPKKD